MSPTKKLTRRSLLKTAVVIAPVALTGCASMSREKTGLYRTERPLVQADDPVARSIAYYANTRDVPSDNPLAANHDVSQKCSNCVHKRESEGEGRLICGTFPGRTVSVDGWCGIWAKG